MPLDDVIGGLLRQADETLPPGPISRDLVYDRLTRKVMGPLPTFGPKEKAETPPSKADFSDLGTPLDEMPDFSDMGTPVEEVKAPPAPQGQAAPPAGPLTYGHEFAKGVVEGAKNMVASAFKGLGSADAGTDAPRERAKFEAALERVLMGEDPAEAVAAVQANPPKPRPVTEDPAYRAGEAIEGIGKKTLEAGPGFEGSWTRDIGSGFGSVAAGIGVSLLSPSAAGLMFVTAGQGEAAERAVKHGATEEQIGRAARFGSIAGATDVVDALLPMLGSTGKVAGFVKAVGLAAVKGAFAEGAQEGLQQLIQNAIAKGIYKPDQDLLEDVPRSMVIGAIVGGGTSGGIRAIEGALPQPQQQQQPGAQTGAQPASPTAPGGGLDGEILPPAPPDQLPPSQATGPAELERPILEGEVVREPDGSRAAPVRLERLEDLSRAADRVEPEPTPAQREAGNYRKGHMRWNGLEISIETAAGGIREGTDATGQPWRAQMPVDYGYFKRTESNEKGQQADVFIGPMPEGNAQVFVLDQYEPTTGKFDEHKVFIGFPSREAAEAAYLMSHDQNGRARIGGWSELNPKELKAWLRGGNMRKPLAPRPTAPQAGRGIPGQPQPLQITDQAFADDEMAAQDFEYVSRLAGALREDGWDIHSEVMELGFMRDAVEAFRESGDIGIAVEIAERNLWAIGLAPAGESDVEPTQAVADELQAAGAPVEAMPPQVIEAAAQAVQTGAAADEAFEQAALDYVRALGIVTEEELAAIYEEASDATQRPAAPEAGEAAPAESGEEPGRPAGGERDPGGREDGGEARPEGERPTDGGERGPAEQPDRDAGERDGGAAEVSEQDAEGEVKPSRLEDAGEKIGGARKDQWSGGLKVSDLEDMSGAERAKHVTKEAVWPRPDYVSLVEDQGVEPLAAALVKALYDRVPARYHIPRYTNWDDAKAQERYIQSLTALRRALRDVKTAEDIRDAARKVEEELGPLDTHGGTGANVWRAINPINARSWQNPASYSMKDLRNAKRAVEQGFPNIEPWQRFFSIREYGYGDYDTIPEAKRGKTFWRVYPKGKVWPGGENEFATRDEAIEAARAAYEKVDKTRGEGVEPKRPHLDKVTRSGPDVRQDRDIDSQGFITEFGFRGTEFGNWVASDERQKTVNLAFDALHDLGRVLGLPPKALSLNGTLGVAFGARGKGGKAAAHYEPSRLVVNMTKLTGAGTLAHEWAHGFDHYLGEVGSQNPYSGKPQSISGWHDRPKAYVDFRGRPSTDAKLGMLLTPRLRREAMALMDTLHWRTETAEERDARVADDVAKAERGLKSWEDHRDRVKKQIAEGKATARSLAKANKQIPIWMRHIEGIKNQPAKKTKTSFFKEAIKLSGKSGEDGYWARPNEMFARAFESYVFDKLQAEGHVSQYLVQGVEPDRFGPAFRGNPYPAGEERAAINAAFDKLIRAITVAEGKLGKDTRITGQDKEDWFTPTITDVTPTVEDVTPVPEVTPDEKVDQLEDEMDALAEETEGLEDGSIEPAADRPETLAGRFAAHFREGNGFSFIIAARKFAKEAGFDTDAKAVEEALELGVVMAAREIVARGESPQATFKALIDLYGRQPKLGTRTSTSVREQAYSTPVPLAFIASRLADVAGGELVLEPTAGNGALLIEASPDNVLANEINPDRAANLRSLGFSVLTRDASAKPFETGGKDGFDRIITNPPFGAVKQGDESQVFDLKDIQPGYRTHEIDHVIALRALVALKDSGRAVLILGGLNKQITSREARSDAYNGKAKREFFKALYDRYNVTDHFTVAGELYERQGAGWPVDVIVIEGRGKSKRALPAVDVPRIYTSWDELGGILDGIPSADRKPAGEADRGAADRGADAGDGGVRAPGERVSEQPAGPREPEGVRGGGDGRPWDDRAGKKGRGGRVQPGERGEPGGADPKPDAERRPPSGLDDFDAAFDAALDETFGPQEGPKSSQEKRGPLDPQVSSRRAEAGERTFGNYKGYAWSNDGGRLAVDAWGATAAEAQKAALEKLNAEFEARAKTRKRDERTTAKVAKDAAKAAVESADAAMAGLVELFGGGKTVGEGLSFDEETYAKAKPLFIKAAEKFGQFAGDVRELVKRMVGEMQRVHGLTRDGLENMRKYLRRFMEDVQAGVIRLGQQQEAKPAAPKKEVKQEQETERQVAYKPQSSVSGLGTLVPVNMQTAVTESLARLEERVGNLDEFVAKELGYTPADLAEAFAAEQVDALALALDNLKNRKGFIIGDQTGIGKGRVNAAIIRWAIKNDRIPVFVTEKPNLYKDMYRDLADIGVTEFLGHAPRILATNATANVPLTDDNKVVLRTGDAKGHNQHLATLDKENLRQHYEVVFTTYSQMQTVAGGDTARRAFLGRIAPNAVLIFDESHNAGGQGAKTKTAQGQPANRASLARQLVEAANGVFYSSATYAKRPDVMDLYAATDMKLAVTDVSELGEAIARGGVPMQQAVAAMLAKAGQYIRRERSFAGVSYDTPIAPVNQEQYDSICEALADIQAFSKAVAAAAKALDQEIKAEGAARGHDAAVGQAGAISTNFTAVMHNLINQMLLAMKSAPAAQMAIETIQRGEKPVITVANTMESFLNDYAETLGIGMGAEVDADFSQVLRKYLERTRTIIIKKPFSKDKAVRKYLSDEELGPIGLGLYNAARVRIETLDLSDLPISPIDAIKSRMKKAGYEVGEITGRGTIVDYSGSAPVLRSRPGGETSIRGRNQTIARFNNGDLDAIILNQAGATGLSLHASEKFNDQRQRHMVIAQAEANIDTHMQMLGRVHRTGQVVVPKYSQLVADIPAEKRPAAVLAKKMASLNANTTASRGGSLTAEDVPDFINQYGDIVATQLVAEDPDLNRRLGTPIKPKDSGELDASDAIRKMTGRIPLLRLREQEELYSRLEAEYAALLEQMEAAGENALEAKTLDLKAKRIERTEVQGAKDGSGSPFAAPVYIEKTRIARTGKPFPSDEVVRRVAEGAGIALTGPINIRVGEYGSGQRIDEPGFSTWSNPKGEFDVIGDIEGDRVNLTNERYRTREEAEAAADRLRQEASSSEISKENAAAKLEEITRKSFNQRSGGDAKDRFNDYKRSILDDIEDEGRVQKERERLDAISTRWSGLKVILYPGARVTLRTNGGNLIAVVLKVDQKGKPKNPLALSSWKAHFALADVSRQITVPFSQLYEPDKSPSEDPIAIEVADRGYESVHQTLEWFDSLQGDIREERFIATGNLLAAYDWLGHKGRIINYTDEKGAIHQGILTSRDFDLRKFAQGKAAIINDPNVIAKLLYDHRGIPVTSKDGNVQMELGYNDRFVVTVPKSKKKGGAYFLDKELTGITGDFYSSGGSMIADFRGNPVAVIQRLMRLGAQFQGKPEGLKPAEKFPEEPEVQASVLHRIQLTPEGEQRRADLEQYITAIAEKIFGRSVPTLQFADVIEIKAASGWGSYGEGVTRAAGTYNPSTAVIEIALSDPLYGDQVSTAIHEFTHFVEDRLATEQELAILKRETPRLREFIRQGMGFSRQQVDELAGYEVRALASQLYFEARRRGERGFGIHVGVRQWFEKLLTFIQRVKNLLNGLGFRSAEDIFRGFYRGEMRNRPVKPKAPAGAMHSVQANIRQSPGRTFELPTDEVTTPWSDKSASLPERMEAQRTYLVWGLADKMIHQFKVEQSIEKTRGSRLPPAFSAYLAQTLYHGRAGERMLDVAEDHVEPIIADLKREKLTTEDLDDYLLARHAEERNDYIATINPEMPDGGSGLTTAQARALMDKLRREGKAARLAPIADKVYAMLAEARRRRLQGGDLSQDEFDVWENRYQFYVPLRGFQERRGLDDMRTPTGTQGFSAPGAASPRALGRRSESDSPFAYAVSEALNAIDKVERNRVAQALLRLVRAYPHPDLWEEKRGELVPWFNEATGQVEQRWSPVNLFGDEVVTAKIGGKPFPIVIHHPRLAEAFHTIGTDDLGRFMRVWRDFTRLYTGLRTRWNPEFIVVNFLRDQIDANLAVLALGHGPKANSYYMAHLPKAVVAAFEVVVLKNHRTRLARLYDEFRHEGGKITFAGAREVEEVKRNIEREMKAGNVKKALTFIPKLIEGLNEVFETATRLALYDTAKHFGHSKAEAASAAREGTLNFNRHGASTVVSFARATMPFFNPTVQAPVKFSRMMTAAAVGGAMTKAGIAGFRKAVYGLMIGGFLVALFNRFYGGDDDDGEAFWDKVPDHEKQTNVILMTGSGKADRVKMPTFAEAMFFWQLGQNMADVMAKKGGDWAKAVANMLEAFGAMMPVLGSRNYTPPLYETFYDLRANKDHFGRQIYPTPATWAKDRGVPASQIKFPWTDERWQTIAEGLGRLGGGDRYTKPVSLLDVHPEVVSHLAREALGGTGAFVAGGFRLLEKLASGVPPSEVDMRDYPILRRYFGQGTDVWTNRAYREVRDKAFSFPNNYKNAVDRGDREAVSRLAKEGRVYTGPQGGVRSQATDIIEQSRLAMRPLNQEIDALRKDKTLSTVDRERRMKELGEKRLAIKARAIRQLRDMGIRP